MKNLKLVATGLLTMFLSTSLVSADSMPGAEGGKILLDNNITLASYDIPADVTEIDLGNHTLTINTSITNSQRDITIKNGKIVCEGDYTCIQNNKGSKMTLDSLTVSAMNTDKGTLTNLGEVNVKNSTLKTKTDKFGKALNSSLPNDAGDVVYNIEDTTLEGYYTIYTYIPDNNGLVTINMNGGELKGTSMLKSRATLNLSGEVTGPYNYMTNDRVKLAEKTRYTLSSFQDESNIIVPEGTTLVIPDDVEVKYDVNSKYHMIVNGTVEGNLYANVYDEGTKSYYGTLKNALIASKKESSFKVLNDFTEPDGLNFSAQTGSGNKHTENDVTEFIIDLNGHTITTTSIGIDENISLTLNDNSDEGNGTITGSIENSGNLEIAGGSYDALPEGEGTLTITGGTFSKELITSQELPEGKTLVENEDGTVTVIDALADYTKLDELLANANEIDLNEYTEETANALSEAITKANALSRNLTIQDQDKIDEIINELNIAINGLKKKEVSEATTPETDEKTEDKSEDKTEDKSEETPNTLDNISTYLITGATSIISLLGFGYVVKRKLEK